MFIPDNINAGGSAICIHKSLLPDGAIATHVITCQGRDHIVTIHSGSTVLANVHFEPNLTLRRLRERLRAVLEHLGLLLATSTSVNSKKEDSTSGIRPSRTAMR